jgi:DNA repair protein RecO (recombination protein O)
MEWTDDAVVLSTRPYGESSLLVQLLTRERGRHAGLAKGGQRGKTRGIYQPGNRVRAIWKARLDDQLGQLTADLVRGDVALFMDDPERLGALSSAASLAEAALPEREAMPRVYEGLTLLLSALASDRGWQAQYVAWELDLLAELGFGLDLSRCAVTGSTTDLAFVSPKSGRAVSYAAGEPYREKMMRLPPFLLEWDPADSAPATHDLVDALALAGYFLDRHVFAPHGRTLPPARTRFIDRIRQKPHNG